MAIDKIASTQLQETQKITLEGGATFHSDIPFHYISISILKNNKICFETKIQAGNTTQLNMDHILGKDEFQVLAYKIANGHYNTVSALRGNASDLKRQVHFYMVNRMM